MTPPSNSHSWARLYSDLAKSSDSASAQRTVAEYSDMLCIPPDAGTRDPEAEYSAEAIVRCLHHAEDLQPIA